jgi:hypothetical protein
MMQTRLVPAEPPEWTSDDAQDKQDADQTPERSDHTHSFDSVATVTPRLVPAC